MKLVLLPGLDGTGVLSSDFQRCLPQESEALAICYPPELCKYDDLSEWLRTRLPEDDFVLIAESFSGPLAARLAAGQPRGLKAVVFVASFVRQPRAIPAFLALALYLFPIRASWILHLSQPFLMGQWANKSFSAMFARALKDIPVSTLSRRLAEVLKVNEIHRLRDVNVPVLYLQAIADRLVPAHCADDSGAANAEIQKIPGPHFLLQAKPQETADAVSTFLRKL